MSLNKLVFALALTSVATLSSLGLFAAPVSAAPSSPHARLTKHHKGFGLHAKATQGKHHRGLKNANSNKQTLKSSARAHGKKGAAARQNTAQTAGKKGHRHHRNGKSKKASKA